MLVIFFMLQKKCKTIYIIYFCRRKISLIYIYTFFTATAHYRQVNTKYTCRIYTVDKYTIAMHGQAHQWTSITRYFDTMNNEITDVLLCE